MMTTDVKHCSYSGEKGHLVPREKMTWIYTKVGRRAICEDCKARRITRDKQIKIHIAYKEPN